ncbi:MAG: sugar phosphate isomerase/epimerase [Planctomycetaceae bacterium]|jgi:sugar phosphate isomerase/epimerase|nr:sugar phosphate isomerase/epimerase [Planctomycetaceae bacterium]
MGKILLGVNMEYIRSEDKPFEWGVAKAAELGYQFVEPMVHWGRELLSEAGYFHSVSMWDDPYRIRRECEKYNINASALSAHCPLCKPDASTDYLKQAVRFAAEIGAGVVCTDAGPKQFWSTQNEDFAFMKYVLKEASLVAEPRGIKIGIEPHQQYTVIPDLYDQIIGLAGSSAVGANFDTGNSYLAGQDPYLWLEKIKGKLVHLHAKDISVQQSDTERGTVTGTPVGCACGDGVIDWEKIVAICKTLPKDIVFSVECGTVEQAAKSIEHLRKFV